MKNFKLLEEKYLKNEQANALVFEHKKTLAKIFVMANDDDNKVFGIGFRTPPKNSNGVCHIIEHSVLNGSEKYKTKEPFMDMVKGSLNTFLNAMTYPDKTIYPVASRNDQDFKNLTDLYLDAVFNPRVKTDERIFRQEGWRYNLEDDKLTYKGVVYNEMRGAMSSLESQVYKNIYSELMPDTIYAHNSGGDPYVIPTLSYEEFLDYYNEFYHPSNSYIFLYGNLDYETFMSYLDEEYLGKYEYRNVNSNLEFQTKFNSPRYTVKYLNTAVEVKENESFVSYSTLTGDGANSKERIISSIINSALIDNESSSLRQKLLSSGLMEVIFSTSQTCRESSFSLVAKNINANDRDKFVEIIEEELKNIVENGIDRDLILSEINDYKFDIREKGNYSTKGVPYFINAFSSWLYDKSPIEAIDIEDDLKYIEENIENGIFEKFIKENILENNHKSIVTHIPMLGLNEQKVRDMMDFLEKMRQEMTETEKSNLEIFRHEMEDFQNRKDTPEEKATIPMLTKDDVDTKIPTIDREEIKKDSYVILKHQLPTSGIDYIDLAFNIDHITNPEDILYTNLLTSILTMLDTENYNYSDLNKKILLSTGGIRAYISQFNLKDSKEIKRKLVVSTKSFEENIEKSTSVLREVILNTKFDNHARLKEIILMIKASIEIQLYQIAHVQMMNRAISNHLEYYKYNEYINGIDFQLFIKDVVEKDIEEVASKLENIYKKIFSRKNLIVNIGSTFENPNLLPFLEDLAHSFEDKTFESSKFEFTPSKKSEGFSTSADVNYISYGNKLNMEFDSKFFVLNNLVSTEFLYTEIRAKGGAYGAGMTTSQKDNFATFSYRDPNLQRTLDKYNDIPKFLDETKLTDEDLLPYIIGAVGKINPPMTEQSKSYLDLAMYISGQTSKDIEDKIENALKADMETLKSTSTKLKEILETSSLAVLGNKTVIEENKDMFDEVIEL